VPRGHCPRASLYNVFKSAKVVQQAVPRPAQAAVLSSASNRDSIIWL
jgi:hypothetical protein